MRRSLALLICVLATQALLAQASPRPGVAFERVKSLQHGINLSGWFGGSGDLSQQHLEHYITAADFKLIHATGFDSVRLGVDPALFTSNGLPSSHNQQVLQQIDHVIDEALAEQLAITITVFSNDDY